MATIEEDYVSFETAKLLKEKGFPQSTFRCHYIIDVNSHYKSFENRCGFGDYDIIAPTLAMAMKWLREKHNIVVEPFIREGAEYVWFIHRIETMFNKKYLVFCWGSKNTKYERYEQACEAAIKYCLENLI